MAEHTPGPWKVDPEPPCAVIQDVEDGWGICEVKTYSPEGTSEGNARLIAAAPDLLSLCRRCRNFFDLFYSDAPSDEVEGMLRDNLCTMLDRIQ